jgi:UDP-glucuronate 4-epimerase
MSRVLITGGAGFIGSHLAARRLAAGDEVVILDNFNEFYDPTLKEDNVSALEDHDTLKVVRGDIRDPAALENALSCGEVDVVVHLAAMPGVRPSVEAPALYFDVNCTGTARLLEAVVRQAPGARFVFGSSSSVYGDLCPAPFREDEAGDRPISPYAASKRAGELQVYVAHRLQGLEACSLRFFTVYGPRQRPEMAIHKFTRLIDLGQEVVIFGDGSARRDFTYVTDIVDGIESAMERRPEYRVYNLGESRTVTVLETVQIIAAALGKEPVVRHAEPCEGDVPVTYADISRARKELGYDPKVDLRRGIELFVSWFREEQESRAGDRA